MGLSRQHWAQQVLLARCYHHDMAIAVVMAVARCLDCHCTRAAVSAAASSQWTPEIVENWAATFWASMTKQNGIFPAAMLGASVVQVHDHREMLQRVVDDPGADDRAAFMRQLCGEDHEGVSAFAVLK